MKKSTISAIAAVSVVGAFAIGLGAVSDWYRNWDVNTWFGRGGDNSPVTSDDRVTTDGAIVSDGENNGISILSAKLPFAAYAANGISEQADTAYILTATVAPANADNKAVDWSVAWVDGDSDWANGKTVTDYVVVAPKSDDALTATVECKQAFGERIVITVISRENADISATCNVDYKERLNDFNFVYTFGDSENTLTDGAVLPYADNIPYAVSLQKSACTISAEFKTLFTVSYTDEFKNSMVSALGDNLLYHEGFMDLMLSHTGKLSIADELYNGVYNSIPGSYAQYFYEILGEYYTFLREYNGNIFEFDISVTDTSTNQVTRKSLSATIDKSGITIPVANITLGSGSIVF